MPSLPAATSSTYAPTNVPTSSNVVVAALRGIPYHSMPYHTLCHPILYTCSWHLLNSVVPFAWHAGSNLGGFLSPILVGAVAKHYGWQWGMWAPGMIGLVMGTALLFTLKDKPEDAGGQVCCDMNCCT